jgi:hypothetical protein
VDETPADGEGLESFPALCGVAGHEIVYPSELGALARERHAYHVFSQVCGCDDLAYLIALQQDRPHTRVMASVAVVADLYVALPWITRSHMTEHGVFESKVAPSYPALLEVLGRFADPERSSF